MFNFRLRKQLSETFLIAVDFEVHAGEMTVLIGKSGAGKTSILDAIAGLLPLDEGWIKHAEQDYTNVSVHLRRFGYVKQNSALFPHLTVLENMTYRGQQSKEKLEEYIAVFELSPHLNKHVSELSGGEAKRVAIVRTLMSNPQLLLLDEAFSALDAALRLKIRTYLKEQLNIPTILVTHDIEEAKAMSHHILRIEQGKIVERGIGKNEEMRLSVAILAGGKGSRLGGFQKAFLKLENQTFIEKTLAELSDFSDVFISARDATLYDSLPFPVVVDETERIGPLGGLYSALKHCKNDYLFVWAVDMPYFEKELLLFMTAFISSDYDAFVMRSTNKVHPLCAIYRKSVLPTIKQMINEENYHMMALLARVKTKYIPLSFSCFGDKTLLNVNTKSDLRKVKKPAVFCVSGVKNSGKTTLITTLIRAFKAEGYRVGVIKHDGHEFEIDHVGTDTYHFQQAGSDATLIYSDEQFALMKRQKKTVIEDVLHHFYEMDLVVIEGLKQSTFPKIEVVLEHSVCLPEYLLAVVTDGAFKHEGVPTFKRTDVRALVALIKRKVLSEDER
ncbi:MAG: molybdopterin-guanine dinucleotide biosynthesis protein B [Turicibacter sp.]|nr:molybdopterin-guanine dinucleotide biosynthesis protein B [Turicibacter sp.]